MSSFEFIYFTILVLTVIISCALYVIFGQVTVRKLRKKPETKDHLGVSFVSGWDIINVAQALSLPKVIIRRFEKSSLSFLEANAELLYKHTTTFDKFLARTFYWLFTFTWLSGLLLVLLDAIGVFD